MKNLNILIVEDNLSSKKHVIDLIKSMNHYSYSIIEAPTLKDLNKYASENKIDIVLLSAQNSEWEGINSYKNLESEFPEIGKIIFVEKSDDPVVNLISSNSINDYLLKDSFNSDDLYKSIFKIAQWKEKLDELKESKMFFEAALDSLEDSIVILNEEKKIIYLNKQGKEFAKANFKDYKNYGLNENFIEVFKSASKDPKVESEISSAIDDIINEKIEKYSQEFHHKIGSTRFWYSLKMTTFLQGDKKRIIAKHQNITKTKESQYSLEISNKFFENSIDLLGVSGFDGYLKVLNPAWTKILGWSKEKLLSKRTMDLVHPDDLNKTLKTRADIINGIECVQFENRILTKKGDYVWLSWNIFPVLEDKISFIVARDITENKNIEFELTESKKEAEKSDRLKSEFLTQMSHEIRTPLNSLLGFASLIKMELGKTISDEWEEVFNHMELAGKRIFRTIEQLIKISELHTENYDPEFCEIDLAELLENLVREFKPIADKKNLELKLINTVRTTNLMLDKRSVTDIFSNLIDNALKYTHKGSVTIFIKPTLFDKTLVTVKDTGIGISEKFIGNMFNLFSQETSGYTRKFDGNGLGLSLVKQYCDLNKANIFASSQQGVGSSFTVVF